MFGRTAKSQLSLRYGCSCRDSTMPILSPKCETQTRKKLLCSRPSAERSCQIALHSLPQAELTPLTLQHASIFLCQSHPATLAVDSFQAFAGARPGQQPNRLNDDREAKREASGNLVREEPIACPHILG